MPLTMINTGETGTIKKVGGSAEVHRFLENLGFVCGEEVSIVSSFSGNMIVSIKGSRVAINHEMARKILV